MRGADLRAVNRAGCIVETLGFGFAREVFRQDDRFGEFFHGTPQAAAFVAEAKVGLFFRQAMARLEDPFGALDELARFELALHLFGFFEEAGVFVFEESSTDGGAHLLAGEGEERDFARSMLVFPAVVDVDDADGFAAADERNGKKRFVGVFDQRWEALEAVVIGGVFAQSDNAAVFGDPAGNAFAHLHAEFAEIGFVRKLRGAEYDFAGRRFNQVDQAGIASGDLGGKADDFAKHLVDAQL